MNAYIPPRTSGHQNIKSSSMLGIIRSPPDHPLKPSSSMNRHLAGGTGTSWRGTVELYSTRTGTDVLLLLYESYEYEYRLVPFAVEESGRFGDPCCSLRLLREIATRGVDDGFLPPPTSWLSFNKARLVSYWVDMWLQDISLSLAHHLTSLVFFTVVVELQSVANRKKLTSLVVEKLCN